MTVIISERNLDIIRQQGIENYPNECCGLLLGVINNSEKKAIKVIPVKNDWENQKHLFTKKYDGLKRDLRDSFAINPLTLLKIQKEARNENLNIVGIYHSHPDHSAIPSDFDRDIAYSVYSYLILSVQKNKVTDIFSWLLDDNGQFVREKLVVIYSYLE
ncbi:M67 family metallopeptidase [Cyanobacterium sp. Dongsha4]|uniref:M67 family metallopeptidase n=1 Tax=Cyanobacterium sp. DS4 TaxID=2878255 RepID=UPI002E81A002|nr:M67 family metallopeptidase [Cyanobacterium sp. Dongsha4]WVK99650.1 M67 family metallopeptidase [Cyanobacterium sp. Dongsha4]